MSIFKCLYPFVPYKINCLHDTVLISKINVPGTICARKPTPFRKRAPFEGHERRRTEAKSRYGGGGGDKESCEPWLSLTLKTTTGINVRGTENGGAPLSISFKMKPESTKPILNSTLCIPVSVF